MEFGSLADVEAEAEAKQTQKQRQKLKLKLNKPGRVLRNESERSASRKSLGVVAYS